MICSTCLTSSRVLFFRGGVCERCDPTITPPKWPAPEDGYTVAVPDVVTPEQAAVLADLTVRDEAFLSDEQCAAVLVVRSGWLYESDRYLLTRLFESGPSAPAAPAKPEPTGKWIGTIGAMMDIPSAECTEIKPLPPNAQHPEWGQRSLVRFVADGAELVWFASEGTRFGPKVGGTYAIRAKVKAHDEYAGKRNTIISRTKELP